MSSGNDPLEIVHSEGYERYLAGLPEDEAEALRANHREWFARFSRQAAREHPDDYEDIVRITDSKLVDWHAREKSTGDTLLHKLACIEGADDMIKWAIGQGANPNLRNQHGETAAHALFKKYGKVHTDHLWNLHALLSCGAALTISDNEGNILQHWYNFMPGANEHFSGAILRKCKSAEKAWDDFNHLINQTNLPNFSAGSLPMLANIGLHHAAMHPSRWVGKEAKALDAIAQQPPYLQEELALEMRGLSEQAGRFAERPLKAWTAAVSAAPAEARAL